MRIFVTGLALQGNKGGPALALSLMQALEPRLGPADFTFSVPWREIDRELEWARRYGVNAVADFGPRDVLPPFVFADFRSSRRRVSDWMQAMTSADLVIDCSGISYVGPPMGRTRTSLVNRYRYFRLAERHRRPFMAWTQSYGPFTSRPIRWMARRDLGSLPVVFCRGADCAHAVSQLLPGQAVEAFPDVAITLDYDQAKGRDYLREAAIDVTRPLASVSPSAVLYDKSEGSGADNGHVRSVVRVVRALDVRGYDVVVVPHTSRPDRREPNLCDLTVGKLVAQSAGETVRHLVAEDLSPVQLKSIISATSLHVGGRYHSIVAALSSGVPSICLSWHPKYRDIMRFYGTEEYVVEAGIATTKELEDALDALIATSSRVRTDLVAAQAAAETAVARNADLFAARSKELL